MSCAPIAIIKAPPVVRVVPSGVGPIAIVNQGPRGPAGVDASSTLVRIAAQALGGHRVVRALAGSEVDYASNNQPTHADMIVGLTMGAALSGADVQIRAAGEIQEGSWSWTLGPVFCGLNGVLTQTAPTSGFIRQIGIADAPDRIVVDLRPPILL